MPAASVLEKDHLQDLFDALAARGHQVIGPALERGALVYGPVSKASDLPMGYLDEQEGGRYRFTRAPEGSEDASALFRYVVGPHSWKRYLFPPRQKLWSARRTPEGFTIDGPSQPPPSYAFFGARACELAAMRIQDRVFDNGDHADSGYTARRAAAFVVAVECTRAGGTCFCASMGTGPAVQEDYDLALTELIDGDGHRFLVRSGSQRGAEVLQDVHHREATPAEQDMARRLVEQAAAQMGRTMPADADEVLRRNPEHPRWLDVATRCLGCANCTLVCPTCFCSAVEDTTSLDGETAERWRQWDSCFTLGFSYIHGGPVRREAAARYRQWITHKLAHWHGQFGSSGCTGCGRCITWCPVGIDITAEVAAIRESETLWEGGV